MADYQAFNEGPADMLAARNAAWAGYQGIGSALPPGVISYLNGLYGWAAPDLKAPDFTNGNQAIDWYQSHGYDYGNPDDGSQEAVLNPENWRKHNNASTTQWQTAGAAAYTSPDGKYSARPIGGGAYQIDDLSRGAGEQSYSWYNPDGSFNKSFTGAKNMTNWQGVLAVVGAALGMGALGAAAGGAGAAGAAAGEAGAGAGAAGAGAGAGVTGFGDAGLMYGGADAAAAGSLGGGASVAGGSALGAGAAGAAGGGGAATGGSGVTGFGDAGTMYGGADAGSASTLGGGASVNGGAALGGAGSTTLPPTGGSGGSGSSGSGSSTTGTTGTPPPANPYATGAGGLGGLQNILNGTGSASDYAGILAALGGAAAGSQGQSATQTSTQKMDPRMDALFYGGLAPQAQSLLGTQMPVAQAAGNQLMSVGSGLLGQTAPTTATNPYLAGVANDMQRRTTDLLGQNNLAIQGNYVGTGGLGGSRQGVAQGVAAGKAADSLQGQVANLYGTAYAGDQNRLIQQQTLGGGLLSQGLATPWQPLQATSQLYQPFTGFGTNTNTAQQGGGALGALGGALGAAQYGHAAGWW